MIPFDMAPPSVTRRVGQRVVILGTKGCEEDVRFIVAVDDHGCQVDPPLDGKTYFYHGQLAPAGPGPSGAPA
jgi:hypothetical protein